jgi:hypothetical protein
MRLTLAAALLLSWVCGPVRAQGGPPGPPGQAKPPEITFDKQGLALAGLTPAGKLAWYSLAREPQGYTTRIVQRSGVEVADALGEAKVELEDPLPPFSVWLVVDLTSGGHSVARPEPETGLPLPFREALFPGQSLARNPQGKLNRLMHTRAYVELFLARPGVGAWVLAAGEGAEGDDDGRLDGSLRTALETMKPVGDSPAPPDEYAAKDILMIVDPRALEYYALQLVN